jgi:hypothetical protein
MHFTGSIQKSTRNRKDRQSTSETEEMRLARQLYEKIQLDDIQQGYKCDRATAKKINEYMKALGGNGSMPIPAHLETHRPVTPPQQQQ